MSEFVRIARIGLPVPVNHIFDYRVGSNIGELAPGCRVRVPFGSRRLIGIVIEISEKSSIAPHKLKKIDECIDEQPILPASSLEFLCWAAGYYHYPVGEVVHSALPLRLRQGKPVQPGGVDAWVITEQGTHVPLTELARAPRQRDFLQAMRQHKFPLTAQQLMAIHSPWQSSIKSLVKKGWVEKTQFRSEPLMCEGKSSPIALNPQQQQACLAIQQGFDGFHAYLLNGITGSGKTEVYIAAMNLLLAQGHQVLMLVPEIGLTPQLVKRIQNQVDVPVLQSHSALTNSERAAAWYHAASGKPVVLIGTRSAIFTPMPGLALIIVDEEHDLSFKQQDGFRYHARDLAVMRGSRENLPVVLGSATPSLESMFNVEVGRYKMIRLTNRAGEATPPKIGLIDLTRQPQTDGLSPALIAAIKARLQLGEQTLLFLNRRGFAPVIICKHCGWTQSCPRCDSNMVMHRGKQIARCHHCGREQALAKICPGCGAEGLGTIGQGTERVEDSLQRLFPDVKVVRIDRDSTMQKGALEEKLLAIDSGHANIIVGTQMLTKGHDFPLITLVGVLNVDQGLYAADFHGPEYLMQQIIQVAGRAGRGTRGGEVLVQTNHPQHPVFQALLHHSYEEFVTNELAERRSAGFPPYSYLLLIRAEATYADEALNFLTSVGQYTNRIKAADKRFASVQIFDAVSAPMIKRAGRYRAQLLMQSDSRPSLHKFVSVWLPEIEKLPAARKVRWSLDVDPVDLY